MGHCLKCNGIFALGWIWETKTGPDMRNPVKELGFASVSGNVTSVKTFSLN